MRKYQITDGKIIIEAESAKAAYQKWVDTGDWGNDAKTTWVTCHAVPLDADGERIEDESESHTIAIDPTEPDCCGGEHDWANSGVYGHGGGVICTEVCRHCGLHKITDTWAQNPETGEQGMTSVKYTDPDGYQL